MSLKKAKRHKLILAMAMIGPSGSGKTVGGLILAYGMMKAKYPEATEAEVWAKIGLVDTEHERSLVYVGLTKGDVTIGEFWHWDLKAPYSVARYKEAVEDMKAEGVEVVVVDSLSHAWTGEGGVVDVNDSQSGKNSFSNWNDTNKQAYNPLVSFAVGESTGVHMINTIRSKQGYAMETDDNGKAQVVKVGLQPIQRDQFEYEFQIALNVGMDHKAQPSKDNSDIFEGFHGKVTQAHGAKLYDWLESGVDIFAERRAEEAKREADRLALVDEMTILIYKHEKDPVISEWLETMQKHPTLNKPLENLSYDILIKFHTALLAEIDKNQPQEEGN